MCVEAGMRGTILLSLEGINVVVAAEPDAAGALLNYLRTIPGLANLNTKISESDHQPVNRMLVKIKKEIIAFYLASFGAKSAMIFSKRGLPRNASH